MSLQGRIFRSVSAAVPASLLRPLAGPAAVLFHGVEREGSDSEPPGNHHRLDRFCAIASELKREFDVAPLDEIRAVLKRPEKHRRTVFLMSDDGYANTLSTAAGVLQNLDIPWTLFVSTHHIGTGDLNPMFLARRFVGSAPDGTYEIPHIGGRIALNGARNAVVKRFIGKFRRLPAAKAQQALTSMRAILSEIGLTGDIARCASERFLDWDGVRALARRGVTIGAHAHWHWAMHANEEPEYVRLQAELPRTRIEAEVGACRYFAYPFGNEADVSAAAWRAVRNADYEFAFTTMSGALCPQQNRWLLPRYGLGPHEPNLSARLRLLRLGNRRLARWQRTLD